MSIERSVPQYLIDEINMIDEDSIVDDEAFLIAENLESRLHERKKIIELLKSLIEPSSGDRYADTKKTEFIVAQLRAIGVPVDDFFDLLGMGFAPEMVAEKMLDERDEQSNPNNFR